MTPFHLKLFSSSISKRLRQYSSSFELRSLVGGEGGPKWGCSSGGYHLPSDASHQPGRGVGVCGAGGRGTTLGTWVAKGGIGEFDDNEAGGSS